MSDIGADNWREGRTEGSRDLVRTRGTHTRVPRRRGVEPAVYREDRHVMVDVRTSYCRIEDPFGVRVGSVEDSGMRGAILGPASSVKYLFHFKHWHRFGLYSVISDQMPAQYRPPDS